jgi:hypothetical protein
LFCSGWANLSSQKRPDPFSNAPAAAISEIAVPVAAMQEATNVGHQVETKTVSPDGTWIQIFDSLAA